MKYFKLDDKRTLYVDVDDTIVMWGGSCNDPTTIPIASDDGTIFVHPHTEHLELIKNIKSIGWKVVIWSQGGSDHAERVIKALKLEDYVDAILPKPESYIDDLPFEAQYIKRIYKEFKNEKS